MVTKSAKSQLKSVRWEGGNSLTVYQKIVDGPSHLLDRVVALRLTFEEVDILVKEMQLGTEECRKSNERVARQNKENCE